MGTDAVKLTPLLISTVALARWKSHEVIDVNRFNVLRRALKPLKRLGLRGQIDHRAKATVLMK